MNSIIILESPVVCLIKINLRGYWYYVKVSTFYLQNPSATVGGGLFALEFAPWCKSFSIKEGLGCKEGTTDTVTSLC